MNTFIKELYTQDGALLNPGKSLRLIAKSAPTVRVLVEMNRKQMARVEDEYLSGNTLRMSGVAVQY